MTKTIRNFIAIVLFISPIFTMGQSCESFFRYYVPVRPFKYDSQSKSAACETGGTYKFIISLQKGKEYRISFHASPSFNNKMNFKIIDENTGDIAIDLPGDDIEGGESVLKGKFNGNTEVYPHFDFIPENSTKLKIVIEIPSVAEGKDRKVGCVGMYMQNKIIAAGGFEAE